MLSDQEYRHYHLIPHCLPMQERWIALIEPMAGVPGLVGSGRGPTSEDALADARSLIDTSLGHPSPTGVRK